MPVHISLRAPKIKFFWCMEVSHCVWYHINVELRSCISINSWSNNSRCALACLQFFFFFFFFFFATLALINSFNIKSTISVTGELVVKLWVSWPIMVSTLSQFWAWALNLRQSLWKCSTTLHFQQAFYLALASLDITLATCAKSIPFDR